MARIGIAKKSSAPLNNVVVNKAGGVAYEIKNPVENLIHVIGHMANEPKYYADGTSYVDPTGTGIDSEALGVIQATQAVLNGPTPEDAFVVQRWARDKVNGLKLRTTPLLSFVTAAEDARPGAMQIDKKLTRRWGQLIKAYASHVMARADEPRLAFAGWSALFGNDGTIKGRRNRNVPTALKDAIAKVLMSASEQLLAKWAGSGTPSLGDVIRICCPELVREPKFMYFVNKSSWLAGGACVSPKGKNYPKHFDPKVATPVLYARHLLGTRTTWDEETKKLISQAHVEWEFALSQFGHDPACKNEIWEKQFKSMPYMATIKNLRNLVENGVEVDLLCKRISDTDQVRQGGLLPFRYLSAARIFGYALPSGSSTTFLTKPDGSVIRECTADMVTKNKIVNALSKALDESCKNLPEMPGVTAILVDVSGSTFAPLSGKSAMSIVDAEAILAGCWARRCDNTVIVPFATGVKAISFINTDSALTIAKKIIDERGGATNAHLAIEYLQKHGIQVDRIIMLSDMQCWDTDGYLGHATHGTPPVQSALAKYRKTVNKDVWFHSVNLAGTTSSPVKSGEKVAMYSGFSEQLLSLIAKVETNGEVEIKATSDDDEAIETEVEKPKAIRSALPTIEELRKQYSLNVLVTK